MKKSDHLVYPSKDISEENTFAITKSLLSYHKYALSKIPY